MTAANMLKLYITHIDDSIEAYQRPYLYFWGITCDQRLLMKNYLKSLKPQLERSSPLMNLNILSTRQIYCLKIKHLWHRATIPELKLSENSTIEVFCIDLGVTYSAPLTAIQTLDTVLPGSEVENIKNWPALSKKFILADVCAPHLSGSLTRLWSEAAMNFLKRRVKNHVMKALVMGSGECEILKLFFLTDRILADILLNKKLCDATRINALAMHNIFLTDSINMFQPLKTIPCKRFFVQTENEDEMILPKKLKTTSFLNTSREDSSFSVLCSINYEVSHITSGIHRLNISEEENTEKCDATTEMSVDTQDVPNMEDTVSSIALPLPSIKIKKSVCREQYRSKRKAVQNIIESALVSGHPQDATNHRSRKDSVGKRIIVEIRDGRMESGQSLGAIPKRSIQGESRCFVHPQLKPQNLVFSSQIISTQAVVPYAQSPIEFCIHLEPDEAFILNERINQHEIDIFVREKIRAFVTKPCLAPFTDGKWYRARIVETNENSTTVYYLDYGNSGTVSTSDLRKLPLEFRELPPLALKCRVEGVEHFSNDFAKAFCNMVVNLNAFTVHCLKVVDEVLHVRLFSSDGIDLVEKLCVNHILEVGVEELLSYNPVLLRENRPQSNELPEKTPLGPSNVCETEMASPTHEICSENEPLKKYLVETWRRWRVEGMELVTMEI